MQPASTPYPATFQLRSALTVPRGNIRVQAYFLVLVDEYPPFALD